MKRWLALIALPLGLAGAGLIAGCGGDDNNTTSPAPTTSATAPSGASTVAVADNPELGQILVDADGRTLYRFEKDEPNESYCNGECAKVWPPYTTNGQPKAAKGAEGSKLDTIKRDDGSTQVTYDGSPLYYYVDDAAPGDAKGNELDQFGAEWYALQPSGANAEGNEGGGEATGAGGGGGQAGGY